ncbi:MAG TPA: ferritin-like domain-containing protein [Solirubrobacterales bacterium]|nr:ferritin-like domain-containing protein [Solirubrobacterales bacterium]
MPPNRITHGRRVRRAFALVAVAAGLTVGLAACGGGDDGSAVDPEADAAVLNEVLGRQLAAVAAYGEALPALRGADLAMARRFRVQEQEHVDATTKTLRGLEQPSDPAEETIDAGELEAPRDALNFLYRLESATIDAELNAVSRLTVGWTRPLVASMAANQAQRLVLIRRALGAAPLETVPEAFETGETSAPEEMIGK